MSSIKKMMIVLASMMLVFCVGTSIGATTKTVTTTKTAVVKHVAVTTPVNINTADVKALTKVKGITQRKAKALVQYRTKNGNFQSVSDLKNVKGFGPKLLKKISASLTV